jgi:hypothetical protein
MVVSRVVRETVDFFLAKHRCPFPVNLGEPVCDISALLVMPLDIGTGGLASRPRFFGTGGLACRPGIGLSCRSDTGGFLAQFGIGLGFGLSFPKLYPLGVV